MSNSKVEILKLFFSTAPELPETPKEYPVFLDTDLSNPYYMPYSANADGTTRFRLVVSHDQEPTPALDGINILCDTFCDKINEQMDIREYILSAEDTKIFWERLTSKEERGKHHLKPGILSAKLDPERRENYRKYMSATNDGLASLVEAWKRTKSTADSNSSFGYSAAITAASLGGLLGLEALRHWIHPSRNQEGASN